MLRRAAVLCTLLVSGCAPAEDTAPLSGGDQGTAGAAVDIALEVRVSGPLDVIELSVELASVEMLSDREPDEAARLGLDGQLALHDGFGDQVSSAAPGAYSVLLLSPRETAPALRLVVTLAGVRVQLEANALPPIRLRCPTPIDVADGAGLTVLGTLDLSDLDGLFTGALFPLPIGTTEISVTELTHPNLVTDVVTAIVSSWSLTCTPG
ncbi:MAG: hypothetical protein H6726_24120 [Sandaracinaceae bacterium]|nr:hypothetical protein [Sandaracinaceae bacterium]